MGLGLTFDKIIKIGCQLELVFFTFIQFLVVFVASVPRLNSVQKWAPPEKSLALCK